MVTTPKLGIPLISSQQAQPEVTHNQALLIEQALLAGALALQNAPPGSPEDGDVYIVGNAPSGAWGGHANAVAIFYGGWLFCPGVDDDGVQIAMGADQDGLSIFLLSEGVRYLWLHPTWAPESQSSGSGFTNELRSLADVNVLEDASEDGFVLTWDFGSGRWIAAPGGGPASSGEPGAAYLRDLLDVQVGDTSIEDGMFLMWDDGAQKWIAEHIVVPSGSGGGGPVALADLTDVELTSPQDGQALLFDSGDSKWKNEDLPASSGGGGGGALEDLSDVDVDDGTTVDGDVLTWDGGSSKWKAEPAQSGSGGGGIDDGNPPTIVQSKIDNAGTDSITMDGAPTSGNLLVAMCFNPATNIAGTGWTRQVENGSGADYGTVMTKIAGGSESATQTPINSSPGGTGLIMIWELSSPSGTPDFLVALSQAEQSGDVCASPILPNAKDCLALGAVGLLSGSANIGALIGGFVEDERVATGSNRQGVGCHAKLSDSLVAAFYCAFSASSSYKSNVAVVTKG